MAISEEIIERVAINDPALKELDFSNQNLSEDDVIRLFSVLEGNTNLKTLNLKGNGTVGNIIGLLADALPNTGIETLNLQNTGINDEGAGVLAESLKKEGNHIKNLYVHDNKEIGDVGAIALGEAIQHPNNHITRLGLGGCNITDEGAQFIALAAREEHCRLEAIHLYNNAITDTGVAAFAETFKHPNNKIIAANFEGNAITDVGAAAIGDSLTHENNKLREFLNLAGNAIADEGALAIAEGLQYKHIEVGRIYLQGNNITLAVGLAIPPAMEVGKRNRELYGELILTHGSLKAGLESINAQQKDEIAAHGVPYGYLKGALNEHPENLIVYAWQGQKEGLKERLSEVFKEAFDNRISSALEPGMELSDQDRGKLVRWFNVLNKCSPEMQNLALDSLQNTAEAIQQTPGLQQGAKSLFESLNIQNNPFLERAIERCGVPNEQVLEIARQAGMGVDSKYLPGVDSKYLPIEESGRKEKSWVSKVNINRGPDNKGIG